MTIYDVFNLYLRILHEQFLETPSFLVPFVSLFCDASFSYNNQKGIWVVMAKMGLIQPYPKM